MKKECAVVQDLLVLYEDDVLREESKEMIEEHIRGCEECMQVYENIGRELPAVESVPEPSEEEQEDAAVRVMKKLSKRISRKTGVILVSVVAALCVAVGIADTICDQMTDGWGGIAAVISTIPTEDIHVAEMYQLKNGDIYCMLEFDKGTCMQQVADWVIPTEMEWESTNEAAKELRFRYEPWSLDAARIERMSMILPVERQGLVEETGKMIRQSCAEISIYGKTKKDKLTIWESGQKVKAAPDSIEEEVIRAYVGDGQITKAIKECELMGWDEYEKIFGDAGLSYTIESGGWDLGVTYTNEDNSILLAEYPNDSEEGAD